MLHPFKVKANLLLAKVVRHLNCQWMSISVTCGMDSLLPSSSTKRAAGLPLPMLDPYLEGTGCHWMQLQTYVGVCELVEVEVFQRSC